MGESARGVEEVKEAKWSKQSPFGGEIIQLVSDEENDMGGARASMAIWWR